MNAITHSAAPRRRIIRAAKHQQAADAFGPIAPGCELFCFTFGQFSLIDAIAALLDATGPADVTLCTWTAGADSVERLRVLLADKRIEGLRLIVDRGFLRYVPAVCAQLNRDFDDDWIRSARTHAKWAMIRNEKFNLAIRTSMNLAHNPRLENIEVSDDPALCDFLGSVADALFAEQAPGLQARVRPTLDAVPWLPFDGVDAGEIDRSELRPVSVDRTA